MKVGHAPICLLIAIVALLGARGVREFANDRRTQDGVDEPYAPSAGAAPFVAVGYREATADLLFVRLASYFGGGEHTAEGLANLVEAIAALDPRFRRIYEWGAPAMTLARTGVDQRTFLRALAVLEQGATQFPDNWRIPYSAGQIYMIDLETMDPAQRRIWDEKGALLLEAAIRKPNAPANAALTAAHLRTRLGQQQRAIDGLREMLLVTTDKKAQQSLLDSLAKLQDADSAAVAGEILEARRRFELEWKRERPAIKASMYLLIGPRPEAGFDMADLATGGLDLVGSEPIEILEPLE